MLINLDIPRLLLILTLIAGLIVLIDKFYWAHERVKTGHTGKLPWLIDLSKFMLPVLIVVLLIRSFVAQLYFVPSESLEPSVLPGDVILVSEFSYGLRLPVYRTQILKTGQPHTGDIVVFHWPVNPRVNYVKRVIGVPGDHISYVNKVLFINGKEMKQAPVSREHATQDIATGLLEPGKIMTENLNGVVHEVLIHPNVKKTDFYNLIVPQGHYFVMGDNRDDSDDSRFWGFVPEKNLMGKGQVIVMSWDHHNKHFRWSHVGKILQ